MAVVNSVGNALTGSTGSGAFVGDTSPTLVTPTLGVASATSINFGGSTLDTYLQSTFNATISFDTPGDLSVAYTAQTVNYTKTGNQVFARGILTATPTYLTASGNFRIEGAPVNIQSTLNGGGGISSTLAIPFPAGTTQILPIYIAGTDYFNLVGFGSGTASTPLTTAQILSGVQISMTYYFNILVV